MKIQTTAYYPSCTPYRLPAVALATEVDAATDRLHIGNSWMSHSGLNFYDNTARLHDPILMHFGSPDPLYTKYPYLSPWSHCAADPVNLIDLLGKSWYSTVNDCVEWTDCKSQEEMDEQNISGTYLGTAHVVFEGSRNERLGVKNGKYGYINGEGALTATVTVYGPKDKDDIHKLVGYTMSSDPKNMEQSMKVYILLIMILRVKEAT